MKGYFIGHKTKSILFCLVIGVGLVACRLLRTGSAERLPLIPADSGFQNIENMPTLIKTRNNNEGFPLMGTDSLALWWNEDGFGYYKSEFPMAICNLFPDYIFASYVAEALEKHPMDVVTFEELAAYTGGLSCSYIELESIEGIGYLTGLTSFTNCKNNLRELPPEIGNLKNLKVLNLNKSYDLTGIPKEIGSLEQLEILYMGLTNIGELPPEIGQLTQLRELSVSTTNITLIPDNIGRLKNLAYLDLHNNDISTVPTSITQLTNLVYLDLSHTYIEYLPENFGDLQALEQVNLFNCRLKELPYSIQYLTNLSYFNVYNNYDLNEAYKLYLPEDI